MHQIGGERGGEVSENSKNVVDVVYACPLCRHPCVSDCRVGRMINRPRATAAKRYHDVDDDAGDLIL